jgi:hypothetical protein
MAIVKQEDRCGHVTFQNRVFMGGILFKINSQYKFDRIVWLEIGCGCGGSTKSVVKHYGVCVGGNVFNIDQKYLVETNTAIPVVSQDFDVARRDQHLNPDTGDYSPIVNHPDPSKIWELAQKQSTDNLKH